MAQAAWLGERLRDRDLGGLFGGLRAADSSGDHRDSLFWLGPPATLATSQRGSWLLSATASFFSRCDDATGTFEGLVAWICSWIACDRSRGRSVVYHPPLCTARCVRISGSARERNQMAPIDRERKYSPGRLLWDNALVA